MANLLAEQQTALFNTVKEMTKYYDYKLDDAVHEMSPFDVIFSIGNEIQEDSKNGLIKNIESNFEKIPTVMHSQLVKMFYDKSIRENLKRKFQPDYSDDNSILGCDMLIAGTQKHIDTLGEIPSPVEVFYLTYASWRDHPEKFNENKNVAKMIEIFLDDINIQASAVTLYLKKYNRKFYSDLEKLAKDSNDNN